ncbi:uncharacterized protein LOC143368835 isoform X1 [Andrena cerasifolii]|uniref:uncharacterized protein LOC143368835 isoform X1 n=3 Tax=Andrena cerasifolii TaxID=2819439 RepID=UPI004037B387
MIKENCITISIMYSENSVLLQINDNVKRTMEAKVIKALQKGEYTLNTVNSYGENLLHISAANGCLNITKEILRKQNICVIDRKNKFGWTPLMLAIRNRDIQTVKFLLKKNANVNESTYLGMSVLGLAAAINTDMFETVYNACPSALLNSANDDITPLCIAAMKNDKNLFFKLLELGFDVFRSNEYTQIMMKQSTVPEIAMLVKEHLDTEHYWNDTSDNICIETDSDTKENLHLLKSTNRSKEKCVMQIMHDAEKKNDNGNENNDKPLSLNLPVQPMFVLHSPELNNHSCRNNVKMNLKKDLKPCKLNLMVNNWEPVQHSLISPTLTCTLEERMLQSPNIYFVQSNYDDNDNVDKEQLTEDANKTIIQHSKNNEYVSELHLQRLQSIRPPDLNIQNDPEDLNATLGYIPEFSPIRSPHVPTDINDENVFGENTPTPPRYRTPPRGMILNSEEAKMFVLLKRYGLSQHVPIFLEQEVDVDLFMTLTDEDLVEIGIKDKSDRKAILRVIMDYTKSII